MNNKTSYWKYYSTVFNNSDHESVIALRVAKFLENNNIEGTTLIKAVGDI
jgi:hypothetical protein